MYVRTLYIYILYIYCTVFIWLFYLITEGSHVGVVDACILLLIL